MRHAVFPLLLLLASCSSAPAPSGDTAGAPPPSTADCTGSPELGRSWGDCNVKQTLLAASDALGRCRKASPEARGTVQFQLKLNSDGSVKWAKDLGRPHGKHTACVRKVLSKLKFAPPGKTATITVPYQLEP